MIKKSTNSSAPASKEPEYRENATVNAKIDNYIKANPKHWEYIQSMPPERMARALVLNEVQKAERRERMNNGILAKLDQNPEMKEHIEGVVKNLPENQRQQAKVNIASQALRAAKRGEEPRPSGVRI